MFSSYKKDDISIRKFSIKDIEKKVSWINNPQNNTYLHYDLPLCVDKTTEWFKKIEGSDNRLDAVIEYKNIPVGLIGLLSVDQKNKKAEYYICIGEHDFKGKGIAKIASQLLIKYAFSVMGLNKIYLYTEEQNIGAQMLFEKLGFEKEGFLKEDLIYNGRKINRYVYGITREVFKNDISS